MCVCVCVERGALAMCNKGAWDDDGALFNDPNAEYFVRCCQQLKKDFTKKMSEDKEKKTGIRPVSRQQDFGMLHVIVFKCLQ
jgi:hypothetical protein